MLNSSVLKVGVVFWVPGDGIASRITGALERLGHESVGFPHDKKLPQDLDVVIAWGPLDSLCPLANQLLEYPMSRRPATVLLMTEQLPNPDLPEWIRYGIGLMRTRVERFAFRRTADGLWQLRPWSSWLTKKAYRFRYYGDLYWLQRQGVLSVLATTSYWTADFLRARGFNPIVSGIRYDPELGTDLNLERDIPVLWLGKVATIRRKRLLKRLQKELRSKGVEIYIVDGVEHPYVYGEERTILLNRTKIVLNILRTKWDDHSFRFTLAAHNRALIVTEPVLPHTPYLPGEHVIEAPVDRMAHTICYYLANETERREIANQAHELIKKYPFEKGIAELLERAVAVKHVETDEGVELFLKLKEADFE